MNKIFILIIALSAIVSRVEAEAMSECIKTEIERLGGGPDESRFFTESKRASVADSARRNCAARFAAEEQKAKAIAEMMPSEKACYMGCMGKGQNYTQPAIKMEIYYKMTSSGQKCYKDCMTKMGSSSTCYANCKGK